MNNESANSAIDDTTDKAEKSHSKISSAFEKVGGAAVKVGKVVATGLGVAATAIGLVAKQSLDSYAEYEQLIGGTELLFGDAFQYVADKAKNAFMSVQMSQNDYLQQVNGFATGLKTALDGDTQAAAELADKIITAEADIVAATGNSQEAVQNAFNGIMKSNFTMLDNLQIGITPTKEGFQEVIDKVNEWNAANGKATQYQIDNLADCQAALVDYVEMQGLAGYAANEAAGTISGSLSMTKAAWQNLLTGFADDSADIGTLVSNLVTSGTTALNNILPRISQIFSGISEFIAQAMPVIAAELPTMLEALLPGLVEGAVGLINGLLIALPDILAIILEQIPFIVSQLSQGLIQAFPALLETVKLLFSQIWQWIAGGLFGMEVDFGSCFAKIENLFSSLWEWLRGVWESVGQPIWNAIQNGITIAKDLFAQYMPIIREHVASCFDGIKGFWEQNLKPCFDAIGNFIETVLAPIFKKVFETSIKPTIETVFNHIKNIWEGTLKPVFTGITDFLTGVFTGNWEQAWEGIKSIFSGILNGIITGAETMVNSVINGINAMIEAINDISIVEAISEALGVDGIPTIPTVSLPRLAKGGILEKGQLGLLEGDGAEAVVPLDQNRKWISAVAQDMDAAVGGSGSRELREMKEAFADFVDALPDMLVDAFASVKLDVNNREFARLVKAVN